MTNSHNAARVTGGDHRLLGAFLGVALPTGWVLLSLPLVLDVPLEPFILATLLFGLVAPALVLSRRDRSTSVRSLLRDTVRLPRPVWLLVPAALLIPVATATIGRALGVATQLSASFLVGLALANVASSLLVVNLWEEMAWAGFVQRRATARWGYVGGAVVVALMFTAVHLPLSLYDADGAGDVAYNIGAMLVSGLGMRLLIGAFDVWGGGSILALGLIHATFNASSELVEPSHDWVRYLVTLLLGLGALALHMRGGGNGSGETVQPTDATGTTASSTPARTTADGGTR
ncbi:MAG TPA: type II CAAX endopeptidase family protein [Nocardioidaceae bacterium]|nr:type II CAAX endopeptidase family protein [Nocardioidaceae bacterium]